MAESPTAAPGIVRPLGSISRMRRMFTGAVLVAATLALAGCTWADPTGGGGDALPDAVISTPSPEPTIGFIPDGTAASGEFSSPDGSTTGSFEVQVTAGEGRVILSDIESSHPALEVRLSFAPRGSDACADGAALAFPPFTPGSEPDPILLPVEGGDWSFLDEIDLIVNSGEGVDDAGCFYRIVAQAPLEWTFPPLRPDLAVLEDGGAQPGAQGIAETDGSGRPVAYTVAADDTHEGVAARFGVTVEDLAYLNPMAVPSVTDDMLYADQRINLDLDNR